MMSHKPSNTISELEGRIAALEAVVLALVGMQDSGAFMREFKLVSEATVAGTLPNATVNDAMLAALQAKLKEYDEHFHTE